MMVIFHPYYETNVIDQLPDSFTLIDHCGGFDKNQSNSILDSIQNYAIANNKQFSIKLVQILEPAVVQKYKHLNLKFTFEHQYKRLWKLLNNYTVHPDINYKNFICSFNGTDHVSRKLLVAILERFGYFTTSYCSKNFVFTKDRLDGHITDYVSDQDNFYRKFFIADNSDVFFNKINSFGHVQYDHKRNIYNLEHKLTKSFLHIVSETMATSSVPFVTEKFLYSIITRGLFLSYAQPGWHSHIEKYYGFKLYTKLFDYHFDSIQNPVERLVELMCMISKFSTLSVDDWRDLYLLEQDTIEYNYDHYFSQDYLNCLSQYE